MSGLHASAYKYHDAILLINTCFLKLKAVMPISHDTIVYGSSDGGQTVHHKNPELYEKLCRAAKMLNLKPHHCKNSDMMVLKFNAAYDE
jgi:hypothetical protein